MRALTRSATSARLMVWRCRGIAIVLTALTLGAAAAVGPATPAASAPPNDTFEITITSGTVVAPGGTISFEGVCWSSVLDAAQEALIRGFRIVGPGIQPFDFSITVSVNQSAGAISGTITVPGNAPNGTYRLGVGCITQDQYLGHNEAPFTVDGPQIITTTSTSTTTSTTTTDPSRAPTTVPPPAPARPLSGSATLTG